MTAKINNAIVAEAIEEIRNGRRLTKEQKNAGIKDIEKGEKINKERSEIKVNS